MFNKKSMSGVLFVIAMSAAACNNVTGPTAPLNREPVDRAPRERAVYDKVCVEELRAVEIIDPNESRLVSVDDVVVITWEAHHVCGSFDARVEISYNDGLYYELLGEAKNGRSMSWRVADHAGAQVKIRVTVNDAIGTLSEELGLAGRVLRRASDRPDRDPEQHD